MTVFRVESLTYCFCRHKKTGHKVRFFEMREYYAVIFSGLNATAG